MKRHEFLSILLGYPLAAQVVPPQMTGVSQSKDSDSRNLHVKTVKGGGQNTPGLGVGPTGRRRALCIGNNAYRFVRPLLNAARDAADVHAALGESHFESTLLTEASLSAAREATSKFVEATVPGDSVFFFYAGHGFQLEGANFLVPIDFKSRDEESARAAAIQVEGILQDLVRKRAHLTVLMLDACRNNPFREQDPPGLAPAPPVLGTMAMFATGAGQVADDNPKGNNGLFTSKLLESFGSGVPLQTMVRKVRDDVFQASSGRQRPYVQEDLVGDFYLRAVAGAQTDPGAPPARDGMLAEGLTLYRSGDFAGAFAAFDKATRIDPSNVYAWNAAGAALAQLGRKAQAVELYSHAIQANPAYAAAYVNRGLAFLGEARYQQAIQDFSWALEEDNGNPLLYQWRGQAYLGVRNYSDGLADLNLAVQMDAGSPESYRIRGKLHQRLGQYDEAVADLTRAIQLNPRKGWQALEDRASVYRAMGQTARAAADDRAASGLKSRQ